MVPTAEEAAQALRDIELIKHRAAVLYILRGIELRPRYTVIGSVLGILCLFGYLVLLPVFWPWMAMACGGTLILSGLWLRSH